MRQKFLLFQTVLFFQICMFPTIFTLFFFFEKNCFFLFKIVNRCSRKQTKWNYVFVNKKFKCFLIPWLYQRLQNWKSNGCSNTRWWWGKTEDFSYFFPPKAVIYTKWLLFCVNYFFFGGGGIRKIPRFPHHQRVFEQPLLFQFWSLWYNQGMKKHLKHSYFLFQKNIISLCLLPTEIYYFKQKKRQFFQKKKRVKMVGNRQTWKKGAIWKRKNFVSHTFLTSTEAYYKKKLWNFKDPTVSRGDLAENSEKVTPPFVGFWYGKFCCRWVQITH